jgi:tetratricopeptide (TPR) repeat protein
MKQSGKPINVAHIESQMGRLYIQQGKLDDARKKYMEAIKIYRDVHKKVPLHLMFAPTYGGLGDYYRLKQDYKNAMEYYEKAMNIYETNNCLDHPEAIEFRKYMEDVRRMINDGTVTED